MRLACIALATSLWAPLQVPLSAAMSLTAVAPLGASAGVSVQITGNGFDPTAANNIVTLTPPSGPAVQVQAASIVTLDAAKGLRRIGITVPTGIAVGTAAVRVTNTVTGESVGGRTLEIIALQLPATSSAVPGATQVLVRIDGSANAAFVAGRTTVSMGAGVTVQAVQVTSPQSLTATVSVSATAALGPRLVLLVTSTQTAQLAAGFSVIAPNRPPVITSTPPVAATEAAPLTYQASASDPDGDGVTFRLMSGPSGVTVSRDGVLSWTPQSGDVGVRSIVIEAADGKGGSAQQSFTVTVAAAVRLQSVQIEPGSVRFATIGATRALTVTGTRTDGSTVPLTTSASGTRYESTNAFVARADDNGLLTAIANGTATITARNGTLSATTSVQVESGVTLDSLELTPADSTIRAVGVEQPLTLRGRFSDGSLRDLTNEPGVTFESSDATIARVSSIGHVTAVAEGSATITARYDTASAAAHVAISISSGRGFVRGEVYDDSKGLPLAGATVTLLADGGGLVTPVVQAIADERGQFAVEAQAGGAVLRLSHDGFTDVERLVTVAAGSSSTILDARLTPLDPGVTQISSAGGGEVHDAARRLTLSVPPGGLLDDAAVTLTAIGAQGLRNRLPLGWSPVAAVEVAATAPFSSMASALLVPNSASLTPAQSAALVRYDPPTHAWQVAGTPQLDPGGQSLRAGIVGAGQFAIVVADGAPQAPPPAVSGSPLAGVGTSAMIPSGATMSGEVVPRSSPPGEQARATARVELVNPQALPSGTVVAARVSERFQLFDQTQLVTQPFTQDIVLYAAPRPATGVLSASFAVTPSRQFTIQELLLGTVLLDVSGPSPDAADQIVGAAGGTVTNTDGDALAVPAAALTGDVAMRLRRSTLAEIGIDALSGVSALAVVQVDAPGVAFAVPAALSIQSSAAGTVLVARAFTDPSGRRRLRLVGIGALAAGRITVSTSAGGVLLDGVRSAGDYVFLTTTAAIGLVTGTVRQAGAAAAGALVTADSLPLADLTGAPGLYVVAALAGIDGIVRAAQNGSAAAAHVTSSTAGATTVDLTLSSAGLTVTTVSPALAATSVPLDASVVVEFSAALDPGTLTTAAVALSQGGAPVATDLVLSADRRRVTLRPTSSLTGATSYALALTSALRDVAGNPLTGFGGSTFTTVDPSRPVQPTGQIVASLPGSDGVVLVVGSPGVASAASLVTLTNVRTQDTASQLAAADGSFRLRIAALVGDDLTVTLHAADGRDIPIAITQLVGADGAVSVGVHGGRIDGANGRKGTILPRALEAAGVFRITDATLSPAAGLPPGASIIDQFAVSIDGAVFRQLASLTVADNQSRFLTQTTVDAPFAASASLTVPSDALANSQLNFTATAVDSGGTRRTAAAGTEIVATSAAPDALVTTQAVDFPSLTLTVPREAVPQQQVSVAAAAPTARIDLDLPAPSTLPSGATLLLVKRLLVSGNERLQVIDRFDIPSSGGSLRLRTAGADLPGLTEAGDYSVVSLPGPIAFVTGRATGPRTIVAVDGSPFVFVTGGTSGRFGVPVTADAAFTLRFLALDGTQRASYGGVAPASGSADVGDPLAASAGVLMVTAEPGTRSVVDISTPIVFHFSEAIDPRTAAAAVVVVDAAGSRVFGVTAVASDGLSATFTPSRRWRVGASYRYGLSAGLIAQSGARLSGPVNGTFTTFAPTAIAHVDAAGARDVALAGRTALLVASAGLMAFDVTAPRNPQLRSTTAVPGGADAVAAVATPLNDRNGASQPGPFAVVVSGSPTTSAFARVYGLADAAAPIVVGSTQLTSAPDVPGGQDIPAAAGAPRAIAATTRGRALVAIDGTGVSSLDLTQSMPLDSSNPARALGAAYRAASTHADVTAAAARIFTVGGDGLTALDATTMTVGGAAAASAGATAVDALPATSIDVNGDGRIGSDETFDLVAVAGAADGTLQLYRDQAAGDPALLSVVRFDTPTGAVRLDGAHRLAYVSLGSRGLAVVDLDGPASVQPLDADHDGIDDRILGYIAVDGAAGRLAVDVDRNLGLVATSTGLTIVQLAPPQTRFLTLLRDPVAVVAGDEVPVGNGSPAYLSDDLLRVSVDAQSLGEPLVIALDEAAGGASSVATFDGGATTRPLADGVNDLVIRLAHQPGAPPRTLRLTVLDTAGRARATASIAVQLPDPGQASLQALRVGPAVVALSDDQPTGSVGVAGFFDDGRIFNLTSSDSGTQYRSDSAVVAAVDAGGAVTAGAGGTTSVVASNGGFAAATTVTVARPAILTAMTTGRPLLTLRTPADAVTFDLSARFSDGTVQTDPAQIPGLSFRSSDPAVVSVATDGVVRPVSTGAATVTAQSGAIAVDVQVTVDLKTPASITGITLEVPADPAPLGAPIVGIARLTGSGSLDNVPVTLTLTHGGSATVRAVTTQYDGSALFALDDPPTAGPLGITASVVDPASGATRTASATATLLAAPGDGADNDSVTTASALPADAQVAGTVDAVTDARDVFRLDAALPGTLLVDVTLTGSAAASVSLVVRDANGQELTRVSLVNGSNSLTIDLAGGATFVSVEAGAGSASYALSTRLTQGAVAIASVAPMAGPAGTLVTITGSGFSTRASDNQVFFSNIAADVITATATQLQVRVPANAVNGTVEVISGNRQADVNGFVTGIASARPAAYVLPASQANLREDPVTHQTVDINRLLVSAVPAASQADVAALAARLGGTVVGYAPLSSLYALEFPNGTFDGLGALARSLRADRLVRSVDPSGYHSLDALSQIDIENAGGWRDGDPNATDNPGRSSALQLVHLFEALRLIRETPPFTDRAKLHDVHVAVIDSGFNPDGAPSEFQDADHNFFVTYLTSFSVTGYSPGAFADVGDAHGTLVTSIISARNDGESVFSGVLNSVDDKTEKPFPVDVYGAAEFFNGEKISSMKSIVALDHIKNRGDIDVVNLSYGSYAAGTNPSVCLSTPELSHVRALQARTLVVAAAGNDGVEARCHYPSALETVLPNVVSVGGVAVANLDGTGEGADHRFVAPGPPGRKSLTIPRCNASATVLRAGSNCEPGVTLAAPGEDVMAIQDAARGGTVRGFARGFTGTSVSAPIVSGVAALLQAIRPTETRFTPAELKTFLTSTAEDISSTWDVQASGTAASQAMIRLNALGAVEAVLPLKRKVTVYAADEEAPSGLSLPGAVVAVDVDPVTVVPSSEATGSGAIPLKVTKGSAVVEAGIPRALSISPDGRRLYVYAASGTPFGDGIAVIDTRTHQPIDFIPLSGALFPANPRVQTPAAIINAQTHPPMALSRDGRLLYVSIGPGLVVINTVDGKLLRSLSDLPEIYRTRARLMPADTVATQLAHITTLLRNTGPFGGFVSGLEISEDGRRLYLVGDSGNGSGVQPGWLFSVNIDLYTDYDPSTPALESSLTHFLDVEPAAAQQSAHAPASDEPGDVAAGLGNDTASVYVVNGGVDSFGPPNQSSFARQLYAEKFVAGTSAAVVDPNLVDNVTTELGNGVTVVNAPGVIDAFAATRRGGNPGVAGSIRFIGDVNDWTPTNGTLNGGPVITPTRFGTIYAKRPMSIAVRPTDGKRALIAYFQTGNFGVMDRELQSRLPSQADSASPFAGVLGVTPALHLDSSLWPDRGLFYIDGDRVDSPDERLLFPVEIRYAQNGRFAAAVHSGTSLPHPVVVRLPEAFTDTLRKALNELGFNIPPQGTSGTDPVSGQTASPNAPLKFTRGGGAISLINDAAITDDLRAHAGTNVSTPFGDRPYFAANPVCAVQATGEADPACANSAIHTVFDYTSLDGSTRTPLARPRAVAIAPILAITYPAFGDHVRTTTQVRLAWADPTVGQIDWEVHELDVETGVAAATNTATGGKRIFNASSQAATLTIGLIFGAEGQSGRTYRITFVAKTLGGTEVTRTSIDLVLVK